MTSSRGRATSSVLVRFGGGGGGGQRSVVLCSSPSAASAGDLDGGALWSSAHRPGGGERSNSLGGGLSAVDAEVALLPVAVACSLALARAR